MASNTTDICQAWKLIKILAQGTYSNVVLVENELTSEHTVAKILLEDSKKSLISNFESEAGIQKELDHSRIAKFKEFNNDVTIVDAQGNQGQYAAILSEYAPMGDLFDLICTFEQMPLVIARSYARQMAEAVAYLHGKGIAHRDIKLENFLLDAKFNLKLTDFGFSCKTSETEKLNEIAGTLSYLAPEQQEKLAYNGFEVDVFSLGVAIFILVAGRMPFEKASEEDDYYKNFVNGEEEKFWEMHEALFEASSSQTCFRKEFKQLINGMLKYESSSRIKIDEVLRHPWLAMTSATVEKCGEIVAEFLKKKNLF